MQSNLNGNSFVARDITVPCQVRWHVRRSPVNSQSIDLFAPAYLKLVGFPAHSPLPIEALPSMSLFPKPPFARVAAATCRFAHLCPPRRSLGVGGSLDSRRLHSRASDSTFTLRFSLIGFARLDF